MHVAGGIGKKVGLGSDESSYSSQQEQASLIPLRNSTTHSIQMKDIQRKEMGRRKLR
jgi:hypothetical protein